MTVTKLALVVEFRILHLMGNYTHLFLLLSCYQKTPNIIYIYFQSPIGKGLIGKNKNDLVEIKTPSGEKNFEIEDVKYL